MRPAADEMLAALNTQFTEATGTAVSRFYCPILFVDEHVELCEAHVVNEAIGGDNSWTIQRKDVDNWYGSLEADFVDFARPAMDPVAALKESGLPKSKRPTLRVDGEVVEHYPATGPVPSSHTRIVIPGANTPNLALKISPDKFKDLLDRTWTVVTERDYRIPAVVSLLKAAHLTMFRLMGYNYALTHGGQTLGRFILGKFFLDHRGMSRPDILKAAIPFFRPYKHMVRPLQPLENDPGSVVDGRAFLCKEGDIQWAVIVTIRAGATLSAVLVPSFDSDKGEEIFYRFLNSPTEELSAHNAVFRGSHWDISPTPSILRWPRDIEYPNDPATPEVM